MDVTWQSSKPNWHQQMARHGRHAPYALYLTHHEAKEEILEIKFCELAVLSRQDVAPLESST